MADLKATVTSKGQITIPKAVRDALGLEKASVVEFDVHDGEAVLRAVSRKGFLSRFGSIGPSTRPQDWKRVRRATAESIGRQAAEEGR